jgi:hypothetical protein
LANSLRKSKLRLLFQKLRVWKDILGAQPGVPWFLASDKIMIDKWDVNRGEKALEPLLFVVKSRCTRSAKSYIELKMCSGSFSALDLWSMRLISPFDTDDLIKWSNGNSIANSSDFPDF